MKEDKKASTRKKYKRKQKRLQPPTVGLRSG